MTTQEIYALPVNGNGWRVLPSGNYVKLGNGVTLGNDVKLGNYVTLGDYVTLGNYVTLGDGVKLGIVCGSMHTAYVSSPGVISIG